jgi:23S rRNA (guanosine2251-2'-O)-methyltransferase
LTERTPFRVTDASRQYSGIARMPVSVLLHDVRSMYNVGAFFRTADGAGAERLLLSGITARPPKNQISKTALGAEESVAWESVADPLTKIASLRGQGFEIAAIETSARSIDLFDWRPRFPLCLVFGHEVDGVAAPLIEACDTHVRIPMLGVKHSLNVATAGGIVLYELLRKWRSISAHA